jgi:hypothetical protein
MQSSGNEGQIDESVINKVNYLNHILSDIAWF